MTPLSQPVQTRGWLRHQGTCFFTYFFHKTNQNFVTQSYYFCC